MVPWPNGSIWIPVSNRIIPSMVLEYVWRVLWSLLEHGFVKHGDFSTKSRTSSIMDLKQAQAKGKRPANPPVGKLAYQLLTTMSRKIDLDESERGTELST